MRVRFPLGAKILAWFFLNLALLALVGLLVSQQRLRFGLNSLVAGPAGDRLRALAVLVVQEIKIAPREKWDSILQKYGDEHQVQVLLFSQRGPEIAGAPLVLPPEVDRRLQESAGPEARPPPPFGQPPPPKPNERLRPSRPPDVIGLQHAGTPARYWVLLHAPLPQLGPEGPAILVVVSDSLSAGGLIFDYRPLLWSALAVIVLSVLFWLPLVRGITRSIGAMRQATARIAEGRFDDKLATDRADELGALAFSINRMSERLAGLLHGQRRFLTDVAHELCAPLSRLQMSVGILEARSANAEELRDVRDEVDQISALVNELLAFSRASLGPKKIELQPVVLRPVLEESVRREAGGSSRVELDCPAELTALGDPNLLLRAISNLLRNAVHYAAKAGPIELRAAAKNGDVTIEVIDRGPGVPGAALPQIFDPFFRADTSRTRETGGVGLGLTIAKTCIESCGGTIQIENISPNGLRVLIRLQSAAHLKSECD